MTRKTWSEVEISAYLDGELNPGARVAFEAALAQDSELRRQVDAVKLTIELIRAVPLREPSRNYLLTPSMVAETAIEPVKRRRAPLFVMRLATSLTAAAFVISFGLNLLNVANPAMVTQQQAEPEMIMLSVTDKAVAEEALVEETIAEETSPERGEGEVPAEPPVAQPVIPQSMEESETLSPEQEMALAPAPWAEPPSDMVEGFGIGGGAGPAEDAPVETDEAQNIQMFKTGEGVEGDGAPGDGAPGDGARGDNAPDNGMEESLSAPVFEGQKAVSTDTGSSVIVTPARLEGRNAEATGTTAGPVRFPSKWIAGVLGVVTLILAAITFRQSRRS